MKTLFYLAERPGSPADQFYAGQLQGALKLLQASAARDTDYYITGPGAPETNLEITGTVTPSAVLAYVKQNRIMIVVVTRGISTEMLYAFRALNVVIVCFGARPENADIIDITIDPLAAAEPSIFSGAKYLLRDPGRAGCQALPPEQISYLETRLGKNIAAIEQDAVTQESDTGLIPEIIGLVDQLQWDSDFFGVKVAYVSCLKLNEAIARNVDEFCRGRNIDVLEYLCDCHDQRSVRAAEKSGYHFVDIRLTYEQALSAAVPPLAIASPLRVGRGEPADIPALRAIAADSYRDSRYYYDGNFSRDRVSEFYQSWIEKAIHGTFDDYAYVIYEDRLPVGFCSIKLMPHNWARIGLVGVAATYAGRGLGRQLLAQVLADLKHQGISNVQVTTQGRNYAAQRLYQRAGFITKSTGLWYHKWFHEKG